MRPSPSGRLETTAFCRGEEVGPMKAIQVELPEKLAAEIEHYVRDGWFGSEAELVRVALIEFVRRNRPELLARFLREDIDWAIRQKGSPG
jgi:Arc/MetJ-type ribon-helix-helix transcriptional regulator